MYTSRARQFAEQTGAKLFIEIEGLAITLITQGRQVAAFLSF